MAVVIQVLGYFVSFLKAISLKLSSKTAQFFINVSSAAAATDSSSSLSSQDGRTVSFPLYTEAIRFAHHKEGMVRAGCRTMTLNVFSVNDPYINAFITSLPASRYLGDIAAYLERNVRILDQRLLAAEGYGPHQLSSLDSQLAEVEDVLSYCSDVLSNGELRDQEIKWMMVVVLRNGTPPPCSTS